MSRHVSFEELLPGDPAVFREDASNMYGVWPDGRIGWVNRGFRECAREGQDGGFLTRWAVGADLWDAVGEPLTRFYRRRFERLLVEGGEWSHLYECSTPTQFRTYRMTVRPVGGGRALLVANAKVVEATHDGAAEAAPFGLYLDRYRDKTGFFLMCASCRRVRRPDSDAWDWVPSLVQRPPPNVSHGLCRPCLHIYYGDLLRS